MTLQDDIAQYGEAHLYTADSIQSIATGLERDYHLVKLADLPEVTEMDSHERFEFSNGNMLALRREDQTTDELESSIGEYVALLRHLQSRESEAAARQARRDELARELYGHLYSGEGTYRVVSDSGKAVIELIITAQDRAVAAEAEVERLKGEAK